MQLTLFLNLFCFQLYNI